MALDTILSAGLDLPSYRVFFALQIDLPGYPLRLIESDGEVRFLVDGVMQTFTGKDPIYGTLANVGSIAEAVATSAPILDIGILPPTEAAFGELGKPGIQGSLARVWFGIIDEATGLPRGAPELIFIGDFDTTIQTEDSEIRKVDVTITTSWERLQAAQEGQRLNDVWHQSIHPGDNCLSWNSEITMTQPWGMQTPTPTAGSQPGGGGSSGGGSGGGGGGYYDGGNPRFGGGGGGYGRDTFLF